MPKTIKRLEPDPDVIRVQTLLSANGYFKNRIPEHGIFELITFENVQLFQLQHVDKNGAPLTPDGVVGPKTWWALSHASGEFQKNHFTPTPPRG
ncbi:MAG: peptidoglycan-binding protein [Desulfobacter sp.]|nr:MAG: peptidoglycan-binding protein [Desulfobacter sp.]